jgi:hypothetical protein
LSRTIAGSLVIRLREFMADRLRVAEQTPESADVEDDTVVVVALKPRRKISGDSQRCIERRHVTGTLRRTKAGIERRHR